MKSIVDVINGLQKYSTLHAEERFLTPEERGALDVLLDFSRKAVDSFRQAEQRRAAKTDIIVPKKDIIIP